MNILTIGIVVNEVAIPIVWKVLPHTTKRGNSNSQQRIRLFARLLKLIEAKDILVLTMDREFGGEKWLKWLDQKKVGYVVRIKKNIFVNGRSAHEHPVTRKGKNKTVRLIMGLKVFFANKVI